MDFLAEKRPLATLEYGLGVYVYVVFLTAALPYKIACLQFQRHMFSQEYRESKTASNDKFRFEPSVLNWVCLLPRLLKVPN